MDLSKFSSKAQGLLGKMSEVTQELSEKAEQRAAMAEQQTKATDILELLQEYGAVPEWLEQKIMTEQSIPRLREWHKASAKVESIEEFLEKTHIEK